MKSVDVVRRTNSRQGLHLCLVDLLRQVVEELRREVLEELEKQGLKNQAEELELEELENKTRFKNSAFYPVGSVASPLPLRPLTHQTFPSYPNPS